MIKYIIYYNTPIFLTFKFKWQTIANTHLHKNIMKPFHQNRNGISGFDKTVNKTWIHQTLWEGCTNEEVKVQKSQKFMMSFNTVIHYTHGIKSHSTRNVIFCLHKTYFHHTYCNKNNGFHTWIEMLMKLFLAKRAKIAFQWSFSSWTPFSNGGHQLLIATL